MISRVIRRACGLGLVVGGIVIVCAPAAVSSAARFAPRPNLVVHLSATPRPAQVGQNLTYTATVRNYRAAATNVTLGDWIPIRSTFVSATASQGSCTGSRPVVCSLGTIAHGASAKVTIVVKPTVNATIVNSAAVRSDWRDRRPWSNRAVIAVAVGPQSNLALGGSAAPPPGPRRQRPDLHPPRPERRRHRRDEREGHGTHPGALHVRVRDRLPGLVHRHGAGRVLARRAREGRDRDGHPRREADGRRPPGRVGARPGRPARRAPVEQHGAPADPRPALLGLRGAAGGGAYAPPPAAGLGSSRLASAPSRGSRFARERGRTGSGSPRAARRSSSRS